MGQHGRPSHGIVLLRSSPRSVALQKSPNGEYGFSQPPASSELMGTCCLCLVAAVPGLLAPMRRVSPTAELMGPFWTNFLLGFVSRYRGGGLCAGQGCSPDVLFQH